MRRPRPALELCGSRHGMLALGGALLLLVFWVCACTAKDAALNAQIGVNGQSTRFVAFLSKKVDFRVFLIVDPYRIVVDMPEVDIQVPENKTRGLILSSRGGLLVPGKSRIVIDLTEPALIEKSEILPPENGLPARLVLELKRASHRAFLEATKFATAKEPERITPTDALKPSQDANDKRPLIVIDPGHGGLDAGAHGRVSGTAEKEITFAFCEALKDSLEKTGHFRVLMTRTIDVFVPLDERGEIASHHKADLLISIHADALDPKILGVKGLQEVRGGTVYTLSEQASDDQAKRLEQQENKADAQAGLGPAVPAQATAEIESILSDLETRQKKNRSLSLAHYIVQHMQDKMRFTIRPHRSANFRVLKSEGVPSVLVELGFLSNDEDEKLLTSQEWRTKTASSLATALDSFFSERQARMPF